ALDPAEQIERLGELGIPSHPGARHRKRAVKVTAATQRLAQFEEDETVGVAGKLGGPTLDIVSHDCSSSSRPAPWPPPPHRRHGAAGAPHLRGGSAARARPPTPRRPPRGARRPPGRHRATAVPAPGP